MDKKREENAVQTNLDISSAYLKNIESPIKGVIVSSFPTINEINIEITKTDKKFTYRTSPINRNHPLPEYQSTGYGIMKAFAIKTDIGHLEVPLGACKVTSFIGKDFHLEGDICELDFRFKNEEAFYRALVPLNKYSGAPVNFILGNAFKVGNATRAYGYIKLQIESHHVAFYDYTINKRRFLIFDSLSVVDSNTFEALLESAIYCFGLLSGTTSRNEVTHLKFEDSEFKKISGFEFRQIEETIQSPLDIINPREHKAYFNLKHSVHFSEKDFENLCKHFFSNAPFRRSIRIITQSRNLPIETRTASYFVALETVKKIIIDNNETKLKSFKDPQVAKQLKKDLRQKVDELDDAVFNFKDRVINKINEIDDIGNNESFYKSFELLGLKLNKREKFCIKKRNDFLHGRFPFDNDLKEEGYKELNEINLRIHYLVCSLILKFADCSCYRKNNYMYFYESSVDKDDEDMFVEI